MDITEKIKEAALEHMTQKVLSGLLLLFVSAFWLVTLAIAHRILPALSPLSIAVLVSTLLTLIALGATYLFYLRRKLKNLAQSASAKLKPRFGVLWDADQSPHCPACGKPLGRYARFKRGGWGFWCILCRQVIPMTDDTGQNLELTAVRERL